MPDPFIYPASSPRLGLPLLFAAQASKEIFVNEALARLDGLLHCAIEGEAATPPGSPGDGECWLVGEGADGEWAGAEGRIAAFAGGSWIFHTPRDGFVALDRSSGQAIRFFGTWQKALAPAEPIGGSVVDSEARSAILSLISALKAMGVLPSP